MSGDLVPADIGPGMVPTGWAESVLERALTIDDSAVLWDAATNCAGLAQKWNGFPREKNEIKTAQMFCEVQLGQVLGPNPGQGTRTDLDDFPHAEGSIPVQRQSEFRRFFGMRDVCVELIRSGKRSRRALLLAVDQLNAVDVDPATVDVRAGDFRDVLGDIDSSSVALILTDPPYPAEYLELWSHLGHFGKRTLIDGGSLVAYCGQSHLIESAAYLGLSGLRYWWTLALTHGHGSQMMPGKNVSIGWKPLLWYVRDRRATDVMMPDRIDGSSPRKTMPTGDTADWAQGVEELEPIISALTAPGDLIVDPFAGSGTTGVAALRFNRRFIGAEVAP
jgi:hypothetical protein